VKIAVMLAFGTAAGVPGGAGDEAASMRRVRAVGEGDAEALALQLGELESSACVQLPRMVPDGERLPADARGGARWPLDVAVIE
jgi:hypothetical protein